MSETPKFEVIDRRKMKAEEEQVSQQAGAKAPEPRPRRRAHRRNPAAGRGWW